DRQPPPTAVPPREARERACAAAADTLAALANRAPVLLIIDDLQWADELTIEVLKLLAGERYRTVPLTVLATYRSEEVGELLEPLLAERAIERFELSRLPHASVAQIVTGMLAVDDVPRTFSEYLFRHSEGNPFFVSEYLRLAVDERVLVRSAGRWQLPHTDEELAVLPTPASVRQLVGMRLAALSAEDLRVVQIAAVCGRGVEPATLGAIATDLDEEALSRSLVKAMRRQILAEHEAGELRFTHDKLREVAYDLIAVDSRVQLHHAAAEALVQAAGDGVDARAAEIASHFRNGQQPLAAARYGRVAGQHALRTAALGDALQHFQQAVASLAGLEPSSEVLRLEVELRLDQFSPRFQLYSAADAGLVELMRTAMPFARQLQDPALLAKLQDTLLVPLFARARYDELFAAAEPMLAEARAAADHLRVAAVLYLVVGSRLLCGEARRAIEIALPVIAMLEQQGTTDELCGQAYPPYISLCCEVGVAHASLGEYASAVAWLERGEAAAKRTGNRYGVAVSHMWWGFVEAPDIATTVAHGELAVHLAREQRLAAPELFGLYSYSRGLALSGHATEGAAMAASAIATGKTIGYVAFRTEAYRALALAQLANGALDELTSTTTAALELVEAGGECRHEAEFRRLRAEAELRRPDGDLELAERELRTALAVAEAQGARVYAGRVHAALARLNATRGAVDQARMDAARAVALLDEAGFAAEAADARAAIPR
ncbi:MAG TPA: hypothetical protein VIV11_22450, partial [Kofleriaceae bacterium]